MPIFQYKAYNIDGREVSGEIEALSLKDAGQRLKKEGLYPKELSPFLLKQKSIIYRYSRISLFELAAATRHLSVLLKSGAALYDALSILVNEEKNKGIRDKFIDIKERISEGSSLANALNAHPEVFSDMYQKMVEAGEASGSLDKVLERLAYYLEDKARIHERVRTALIYPALMVFVGIGVLSFLFIFVIPKITRIFEDTKHALPFITIVLLKIVNLFRNYWHVILAGIAGAWFGIKEFIKKTKGRELRDNLLLKLPYVGKLFINFYMSNFSRTLGSLLGSGVPMLKALDMTRKTMGNVIVERVLTKAIKDVTEGASISGSLRDSKIMPCLLVHIIAIGERSGNLDSLLLNAADIYEKEFETSVTRALSLLEPILILTMGIVVGFIVLAILLPIFELNQVVR